jgi:hypothetical protein
VGQLELLSLDDDPVRPQQIEIEGSRAPSLAPLATESILDDLEALQKCHGGKLRS